MQSQSFVSRYWTMKREKMQYGVQLAKRNKVCYLFLAPYAILFFTFFILPIILSYCSELFTVYVLQYSGACPFHRIPELYQPDSSGRGFPDSD